MDRINNSKLANILPLYVEDDEKLKEEVLKALKRRFKTVLTASNGAEGLKMFKQYSPDIVISDIKMPVMDGIEMAEKIKAINSSLPIIVTTAFSEIPYLLKSIKIGISRYIQKPLKIRDLIQGIEEVVLPKIQEHEITELKEELEGSYNFIFGNSAEMKMVYDEVKTVAATDFTILLQGETGVGKTFLARWIHEISRRSKGPFVSLDISTIPENLIESELFGHKKGAFTGAEKDKEGFFKKAAGGTIFIDELENIPLNIQSKLLRVIDENRIYPVGEAEPTNVDVRVICASNRDIHRLMMEEKFREDLFYRLNEFSLEIPPLRRRKQDIEHLGNIFLGEVSNELSKKIKGFTPDGLEFLKNSDWPGNVRELKNVVRRSALFASSPFIGKEEISGCVNPSNSGKTTGRISTGTLVLSEVLESVEKETIENVLNITKWKRTKAAEILKIDYKTLVRKIEKYGLE